MTMTDPLKVRWIERIQNGIQGVQYNSLASQTDRALSKLFTLLDCDINSLNPGKRLFFTNYSLGYRSGSETGGMTKSLLYEDSELFDDLVTAIKPKVIICLGKLTYEAVSRRPVNEYLKQLRKGIPFESTYPANESIKVYGVSHCGARGISNVGGMDLIEKSWARISNYLK